MRSVGGARKSTDLATTVGWDNYTGRNDQTDYPALFLPSQVELKESVRIAIGTGSLTFASCILGG